MKDLAIHLPPMSLPKIKKTFGEFFDLSLMMAGDYKAQSY
jgi:hypothetical protein